MASELTRELRILPAWDHRAEGKGQHFVEMRWYVKGPAGVVQFILYTGWQKDIIEEPSGGIAGMYLGMKRGPIPFAPLPADLGDHSPVPMYEGQKPKPSRCEFFADGVCFYDGSTLSAYRIFSILVHQGGDAVWRELERYYGETFSAAAEGEVQ